MTQQVPTTEPPVTELPITEPVEEEAGPQCCHHWVIQPATGPVSSGLCQVCGEVREFKNYVEASTWGDDKGASRTKKAAKETAATPTEATPSENKKEE